ncbi:MAG: hypothetical protein HC923_10460 [Myxococcales bacterium]|nr:hypothetical protein [Myxococcales bacterium]
MVSTSKRLNVRSRRYRSRSTSRARPADSLGPSHPLLLRHARSRALREADLVIVLGFPFDFRLAYGRKLGRRTRVVAANVSKEELLKNRRPDVAILSKPSVFLEELAAQAAPTAGLDAWRVSLLARDQERDAEIRAMRDPTAAPLDPIHFLLSLEEHLEGDAVLIADGGDFVGTASYVLRARGPRAWLDPGVFGTLGVGGGFAVGTLAVAPERPTWILYGDGSCAYSLAEMDTMVRHGLAPIAIVGNDGAWAQIARDQVAILGDDVGTRLVRSNYHEVAKGYGAVGLELREPAAIEDVLNAAKFERARGNPVVVNVHLRASTFREGSISL